MTRTGIALVASLLLNVALIAAIATVWHRAREALSAPPTPSLILNRLADEIGGADGDLLRMALDHEAPALARVEGEISEQRARLAELLGRDTVTSEELAPIFAEIARLRHDSIDRVTGIMAETLPGMGHRSRQRLGAMILRANARLPD